MKPVLSKADFVRRFIAGEFGNRGPTWDHVTDYLDSRYRGPIHIRNRIAGGPTWYDVPFHLVLYRWVEIISGGAKAKDLYLAAMAPHEHTLLQGEVRDVASENGSPYLYYTTVPLPMREALAKEARHASGLSARVILRSLLCPRSYEWLEYLLETYPGHVVEFSTFAREWGTVPGFNTVFWEVRSY